MDICYNQFHKKQGLIFKNNDNFYNMLSFSGEIISYSIEHFHNLQNYIKHEQLSHEYLIYSLVRTKYCQKYFFTESLKKLDNYLIILLEESFKLPREIIKIIFDFF
tara:strand:+ start:121 stop:438 length:318 start_codon:yes stop_codon:yes gene_type:complete